MKLRTSYSKLIGFKKDITRFAPVWALYLVCVLLVVFETSRYQEGVNLARNFLGSSLPVLSVVNLLYAPVVALTLFGDLFRSRMCYSLHAMPMRRESWFFSHFFAGICFSLVPNLLGVLYLLPRLEEYWFIGFCWLGAMELQYLFYFGAALFSVQCAGNRLGAVAIYSVLNGGAMLVYWMVYNVYMPLMTGVTIYVADFTPYCPVATMVSQEEYFLFDKSKAFAFVGFGDAWGYVGILSGIGIGLTLLALLLYRCRNLECAGDFVAFRKLKPVICTILALCTGVMFGIVGTLGSNSLIWMTVGVVVGYFAARMLLERRVKVFQWKSFLWLAVLITALWASILLIGQDVFGIVRWTPKEDQVASVTVSTAEYAFSYNQVEVELTDKDEIRDAILAHEQILEDLNGEQEEYVELTYHLTNGRTVKRSYRVDREGDGYEILKKYIQTPFAILDFENWDTYLKGIKNIYVEGNEVPRERYRELMELVLADCADGKVGLSSMSGSAYYWLTIEYTDPQGDLEMRDLQISQDADRTVAWLKEFLGENLKF